MADREMSASQLSQRHDFTTTQYVELLRLAKSNYKFVGYREFAAGERFVLWRHDCDYSLNRSLQLAQFEHDESVKSTYFLNPHCEFYNLLEKGQARTIEQILSLGHDIGLHFDAAYYDIGSEAQLDKLVEHEATWLKNWFGVEPAAFSFHNPTEFLLACERDTYGGLINCYSRTFKTTFPYCSDSNGYWRFRRLRDVLESAQDPCLQVLTHPGWWQVAAQHPRERIFRSVYGRAHAIMNLYDVGLETHGRENLAGPADNLRFIKDIDSTHYQFCDYLWNSHRFETLFIELYRLHERQINKLCKAVLRKEWRVPAKEINAFFENSALVGDGYRLLGGVFGLSWQAAVAVDQADYRDWVALRNQLVHGRASAPRQRLEEGCIYLCHAINALMEWGKNQPFGYDGLSHLGTIGIPTYKTADDKLTDRLEEVANEIPNFPVKRWNQFKAEMKNVCAGESAEEQQ